PSSGRALQVSHGRQAVDVEVEKLLVDRREGYPAAAKRLLRMVAGIGRENVPEVHFCDREPRYRAAVDEQRDKGRTRVGRVPGRVPQPPIEPFAGRPPLTLVPV